METKKMKDPIKNI